MRNKIIKLSEKLSWGLNIFLLPLSLLMCKSQDISKYILNHTMEIYSRFSRFYFYKYSRYDKYPVKGLASNTGIADTAIILQGPVKYENNFTLLTAIRYKKIYPNVKVIVSTWENESDRFCDECEKNGIICLRNKLPENKINTNYQIFSSLCGVRFVEENNEIKYVLKTRTDQRIYNENFIENLKAMLDEYPIHGNHYHMNDRMIFLNAEGSTYKYYHISDMFVFGNKLDLLKMYSIPFTDISSNLPVDDDTKNKIMFIKRYEHMPEYDIYSFYNKFPDYDDFIKARYTIVSELYIIHSFWKLCMSEEGFKYSRKGELWKYWDFVGNYSIVIDTDDLELIWPKYIFEFWSSSNTQKLGQLSHANWLRLKQYMERLEQFDRSSIQESNM